MIEDVNKKESTSGQEVDREILKQERKRKKQAKKEAKRYEAQKQYEQKIIKAKFRPKDQHITIIPRECANNNAANSPINSNTNNDINLEDFPDLNVFPRVKSKKEETEYCTDIETQLGQNLSKKPLKIGKDSSICIKISDILVPKPTVQKAVSFHNSVKYEGNILDRSQPERHKGKKREAPKRKPLSKLKSQIIADEQHKPVKSDYNGIHSPAFETCVGN